MARGSKPAATAQEVLAQNKAIRNPMQFIDAQMKIYADYLAVHGRGRLEALRSRSGPLRLPMKAIARRSITGATA